MQLCKALSALMSGARSAEQKKCGKAAQTYATPLKEWNDVVNLTLEEGGKEGALTAFAKSVPGCWERTQAHELYEMRQFIDPPPPSPPPGQHWTKVQVDAVFASDPPLCRVTGLFRMFPATGVDAELTVAPATWGYVGRCLSRPAGSSASSPSRTPAIPTDMAPSKVCATQRVPIPITKGAVNKYWRTNGVPAAQKAKAKKMVHDADAREAEYNAAVTAHLTALAGWAEAEEQQRAAVGGSQQAKQEPTFTKVHPGERRMMFKAPALTDSRVLSADFGAKRPGAQYVLGCSPESSQRYMQPTRWAQRPTS